MDRRLILIVDDSAVCADTLSIALEALPATEVRTVRGPGPALEELRQAAVVAAVVTDLNMPRATGMDFIRDIRAQARFRTLPVVMISGDTDPRVAERALVAGATAFFAKPYSPAAVRRKLEQLIC